MSLKSKKYNNKKHISNQDVGVNNKDNAYEKYNW